MRFTASAISCAVARRLELDVEREQHLVGPDVHRQDRPDHAHVAFVTHDTAHVVRCFAADAFADQQAARLADQQHSDRGEQHADQHGRSAVELGHPEMSARPYARRRRSRARATRRCPRRRPCTSTDPCSTTAPRKTAARPSRAGTCAARSSRLAALEHRRDTEHGVRPERVGHLLGVHDVENSLVGGHAAADAEDQHGDDQAPEEDFLAVAERMLGRCLTLAQLEPDQQQHAISGIDRRMDALGQHGGTAGERRHGELRRRDREIRADRTVDDHSRFRHRDTALPGHFPGRIARRARRFRRFESASARAVRNATRYRSFIGSSLRKRSIAGLGAKSSSSKNGRTSISVCAPSPCGFGKRFAHSIASSREPTSIVV